MKVANNEVYYFKDAMRQSDAMKFIKVMVQEVEDHTSRGHWKLILQSSIPKEAKVICLIWSFKRKRFPDGSLNKHKAKLCAHGGMQRWGVSY